MLHYLRLTEWQVDFLMLNGLQQNNYIQGIMTIIGAPKLYGLINNFADFMCYSLRKYTTENVKVM